MLVSPLQHLPPSLTTGKQRWHLSLGSMIPEPTTCHNIGLPLCTGQPCVKPWRTSGVGWAGSRRGEGEAVRCNRIFLWSNRPSLDPCLSAPALVAHLITHVPPTHLPLCPPALTSTAPHVWTPEAGLVGGGREKTSRFILVVQWLWDGDGKLFSLLSALLLYELRVSWWLNSKENGFTIASTAPLLEPILDPAIALPSLFPPLSLSLSGFFLSSFLSL